MLLPFTKFRHLSSKIFDGNLPRCSSATSLNPMCLVWHDSQSLVKSCRQPVPRKLWIQSKRSFRANRRIIVIALTESYDRTLADIAKLGESFHRCSYKKIIKITQHVFIKTITCVG